MAKIVSIHSFRGGTGKSNLTANLAATLASRGQRVAVIDTDIQSPGIHALFGLDEDRIKRALNDYLRGTCRIEETALDVSDQLGAQRAAGGALFLVPSSIRAGEITRILREGYDVGRLNDGFSELVRQLRLDHLVIDTHTGLNEETLLSMTISDVLLLVLRPDRQDFQGTAVAVDVARKLEVPSMYLVVNKAPAAYDAAALRQQVESAYKVPVAAYMEQSDEMLQLGSASLFCVRYPEHGYTREVEALATRVSA
jgi:MinD-like ATPase involved in chromosome partitioning or flagellar assembly